MAVRWKDKADIGTPAGNDRIPITDISEVSPITGQPVDKYVTPDGLAAAVGNTYGATTDNAIARFNGAAGDLQDSVVTIDDNGVMTGASVVTTGGSVARSFASRFRVNPADFGDVTGAAAVTAINAAITYINGLGGGEVEFDAREYSLTGSVIVKDNVRLVGKGSDNTILKLATNANSPVLKTLDFDTLTVARNAAGPTDFALVGLTFDGNRLNQSGSAADLNGLSLFGYHWLIDDVNIQECKGQGIRSDWEILTENDMASTLRRVLIHDVGRDGVDFSGPNDTYGEDIIIYDCAKEADDTYYGFRFRFNGSSGSGNGRWVNLHPYHKGAATNRMLAACLTETQGNQFFGCHFEGGRQCLIDRGDRNIYKASNIYGAFSTDPMVVLTGAHHLFEAFIEDSVPSGAACLQIGEGGRSLFNAHIEVTAVTAATNAVVITNDGGRTTGIIKTAGATNAYSGAWNTTSAVQVQRPSGALEFGPAGVLAIGGIGYSTGVGGTAVQATNKATGVTLNALTGEITLALGNLAAGAVATFLLTNSSVAITDNVIASIRGGGTFAAYTAHCINIGAGTCALQIRNVTAGALDEQPVMRFTVIKGVNS